MNFPSQIFFNNINHGYRAAIFLKKKIVAASILHVVAIYFYYERVRRTMRTAMVSNLLNHSFTRDLFNFCSWRRFLSYGNQPVNLQSRSIDDLFCIWYGPLSWKSYSRKIADLFEKNINWTWVSQSIIRWPLKPNVWKVLDRRFGRVYITT